MQVKREGAPIFPAPDTGETKLTATMSSPKEQKQQQQQQQQQYSRYHSAIHDATLSHCCGVNQSCNGRCPGGGCTEAVGAGSQIINARVLVESLEMVQALAGSSRCGGETRERSPSCCLLCIFPA